MKSVKFVPNGASEAKKKSLGRANAAKFVSNLCQYPAPTNVVIEAQNHILNAHATRLSKEQGTTITAEHIEAAKAPRPKILDMFAGGGAIPLEALRLGCDVYTNELNPVAYIIELCTLVYPQKYGRADSQVRGMTGPRSNAGLPTWGGLAEEVRYWGQHVYKNVRAQVGDLYPLVPDPAFNGRKPGLQQDWVKQVTTDHVPPGYLVPVAYLWTRTITCKKPNCQAQVPLVRQTWVCKRDKRFVALKPRLDHESKTVQYEIVEASSERGVGFDPSAGGSACPFCHTVVEADYAKEFGKSFGFGIQAMAMICTRPGETGKVYLPFEDVGNLSQAVEQRLSNLSQEAGLAPPDEPLEANPRSFDVHRYGFVRWRQVFTERQNLMLLTCAAELQEAWKQMAQIYDDPERRKGLYTCVALTFSRLVTQHNAFTFLHSGRETIEGPWGDGKFPMSWDFAEANPFSGVTASYKSALEWASRVYDNIGSLVTPASVLRGSASELPFADSTFDAVITDPPYYDSVSYSNLADAFYIWLKRSLSHIYSEHFAAPLTPKRPEAIKAAYRHNGDDQAASRRYEQIMTASLREASRVLKPGGAIVVVYAHKTTLGWSTLVDALRAAEFTISEAWPLATEAKGGRKKKDKAMLASSIFLAARKRDGSKSVNYEEQVQPELTEIVRERVETLWNMGISGADLVIASVGAGLRAFTRFARVEYANGEEVPSEKFLGEVEIVVLDTILKRLSTEVGSRDGYSLAGLDPATRFYILWRYTYRGAELEAGEAIVFGNGMHVELDGVGGLSAGARALVEKKKGKYRLLDYTERGDDDKLGMADDDGKSVSLIDSLHRTLWLMENRPAQVAQFLQEAQPNREQMRLVAQALAGPALKGGELADVSPSDEMAALAKLTANWRSVVEAQTLPLFR